MFRVRKKRKKQVLQVPQLRDQTKKGVRAHLAETTTVWGVLRIHESLSARSLSHTPHKHTPERSLFLSLALLQTTARGGYMIFFFLSSRCVYVCITWYICVRGNVVKNSKNFAQATNETKRENTAVSQGNFFKIYIWP